MAFTFPQVSDFKAFFFRDFNYGGTNGDYSSVQDGDITNALQMTTARINTALFGDQPTFTNACLFLTAHYMVMNLRASSQGTMGKYSWMNTGKSVGSIQEQFQIPQRILDNPSMAMLTQTYYGAAYLDLILPLLSGNIMGVCGQTKP